MKLVDEVKEMNMILKDYLGGEFRIVYFTNFLRKIIIRVTSKNMNEVVYLAGVGCRNINGKFDLNNINLIIDMKFTNIDEDIITRLYDLNSDFELITTDGFSLAIGQDSEFGSSYDNLI